MESRSGYSNLPILRGGVSVLVGISTIMLPLAYGWVSTVLDNEITSCGTFLLLLLVAFVLLAKSILRHRIVPFQLAKISIVDVFAVLFLCYCVFNVAIVDKWQLDRYMLYSWGSVIAGYLLLRCGRVTLSILLYACCISGTVQSVLALCQRQGWIAGNSTLFDATGSFDNPGQLGGYIAICCILSLGLLQYVRKARSRIGVFFLAAAIFIQLYGLFLSDSRAAWVAFILGAGSLLYFCSSVPAYCRKHKTVFAIFLCLSVIAGGIAIYNYRPASAEARLLIWRVSADMVVDAPLLGHGASSFSREYMLYQASYFKENPSSPFMMVADNTIYPFNEFVGVVVRYGALGLLLVALLFCSALCSSCKNRKSKILKSGLLALSVFSFFSYPTGVFPLLLFYGFLLGGIKSKVIYFISFPSWILSLIMIIIVALGVQTLRDGIFVKKMANTLSVLYQREAEINEVDYSRMRYNINFNDYYMTWMSRQADVVISRDKRIMDIQPSCEGYCMLGRYYMSQKAYSEAKKYLVLASYMIPTRIRPKYYLWELYVSLGNKSKALEVAKEILSMPLKLENSYTLRIKRKMKVYIE